jgi:predicted DNA-binding protein (UPF0251 family)
MSRPQKSRKVFCPPVMKGYKPFGIPACVTEQVTLKIEEYESLKLIDYDMHSQEKAAELMDVSRPTFTRIYNSALKTIIKAFVEGKAIVIEGGNYQFDKEWFRCKKCYKLIEGIENHTKCRDCRKFGPQELINLNLSTNNEK